MTIPFEPYPKTPRLEKPVVIAAPGFMRPEGLVAFHTGSGQVYKIIVDK